LQYYVKVLYILSLLMSTLYQMKLLHILLENFYKKLIRYILHFTIICNHLIISVYFIN